MVILLCNLTTLTVRETEVKWVHFLHLKILLYCAITFEFWSFHSMFTSWVFNTACHSEQNSTYSLWGTSPCNSSLTVWLCVDENAYLICFTEYWQVKYAPVARVYFMGILEDEDGLCGLIHIIHQGFISCNKTIHEPFSDLWTLFLILCHSMHLWDKNHTLNNCNDYDAWCIMFIRN